MKVQRNFHREERRVVPDAPKEDRRVVPIELLRAVVTVVDTGSYTRAASALGLTQPAISAQIIRLGEILGGEIFTKGQGTNLTKRGSVVLSYARRMLAMSAELIAFAGPHSTPSRLVIGLPSWMRYRNLIPVLKKCRESTHGKEVSFHCDRIETLAGELDRGAIDFAYLSNALNPPGTRLAQWLEPMAWVKSPRLILAPGAAIPLITWPGTLPHRVAVEQLEARGLHFYIAFCAPDLTARRAAVAAGLGVMPILARVMTSEMEVVKESLPDLPMIKAGVYARNGLDLCKLASLSQALISSLVPKLTPEFDPDFRPDKLILYTRPFRKARQLANVHETD
jgi:DNA-binding transcriptional LysR family regulator